MRPEQSSNPYGTLDNTVPAPGNGGAEIEAGEQQPLLGRKAQAQAWWRKRVAVDVRRDWADLLLLSCYIITGLLDSASISTWGAFVSMQTGNTVYVGLGATAGTNRWKKSGTSILAFSLGSFLFSRFHRWFSPSPSRKWVLCCSFAIQTLLIAAAAAIVTWGPEDTSEDGVPWYVLVPIGLVAFQSCGQAVASRALKYNALTSVVLTSIYCDLFSDSELFAGIARNPERNRRLAAPILLFIGALAGGTIANSVLGTSGALWIASFLKLLMVCAWACWPEEA